jgi:hypothetical protein
MWLVAFAGRNESAMSDFYGFDPLGTLTPPIKQWAEPEQGKLYSLGVDTAEGPGHGTRAASKCWKWSAVTRSPATESASR